MTQNAVTAQNAVATQKELSPLDTAVKKLSSDAMKRQFATACPTHLKVNAERYIRQFCTQLRLNPRLLQCDQGSLIGAMMTGTALGLDPSPSLGEFYIIPYENRKRGMYEAQFQLGYKGMIALAYRGGVKRFQAHAIHEKDEFDYSLGLAPMLRHKPYLGGERGKAVAYYATAELPSGEMVFEIMSRADVEAHSKKYSRSYNDGPWKTEFDEMAKKTVAKSLFKWIPKSTELSVAVAKDGSIAHITGEIKSHEEVLDADINYLESDEPEQNNNALEEAILGSTRNMPEQAALPSAGRQSQAAKSEDLAPIESDMFPFDDIPAAPPAAAPQSNTQRVTNGSGSELEKLRGELMTGLRLNRTEDESEEWCRDHFKKAFKELTKDDLRAAIAKLNDELDEREK